MNKPYNSYPNSFYIVLEGTNGCGKSTQTKKLYEYLKQKYPNKQVITTREPGGTEIAEAIRKVVQGTKFNEEMEPICEAYLYAAARAQSLNKIVKPVLENGGVVVADRSFFTSLTFQAYGRELGLEKVLNVNSTAIEGFMPNLVLYLEADPVQARKRTFDHDGDKFETIDMEFINRTVDGLRQLSKNEMFADAWETVDANGNIEEVFDLVKKVVNDKLPF